MLESLGTIVCSRAWSLSLWYSLMHPPASKFAADVGIEPQPQHITEQAIVFHCKKNVRVQLFHSINATAKYTSMSTRQEKQLGKRSRFSPSTTKRLNFSNQSFNFLFFRHVEPIKSILVCAQKNDCFSDTSIEI